ncbi:MAG: hypothetical protein HY651_10540 [Acidobacteria bacterium]|nr:hypothetical protein [Acidobacteriota bacterium]
MNIMSSALRNALAIGLFAALFLSSSANAQRRTFTNDDVAPAPPPAPAAAAEEAPAPSVAPDTSSPALPSTPLADLNRVKAIQAILMGLYDEIAVKAYEAADPELKKRWNDINLWLSSIIQANQQTIQEMQARLGIEPAAESEQTESAASPEQPQPEQSPSAP